MVAADAIRWADKHPVSRSIETRCSKERIEQIKDMYEKHYQSVAITLIEEGHSKEEIALIFFELGARAADENPIERKGGNEMCESPEDKRIREMLQEGIQEELLNSPVVDPYPHRGKRVSSGRAFGKTTCYKWVNGELVVVSSSGEEKEES